MNTTGEQYKNRFIKLSTQNGNQGVSDLVNAEAESDDVEHLLKKCTEIEKIIKEENLLTTTSIANKLGISRNTAGKCLAILYVKGKVVYKVAGPSKVWMPASQDYQRIRENIIDVLKDLPNPIDLLEDIRKELVTVGQERKRAEVSYTRR